MNNYKYIIHIGRLEQDYDNSKGGYYGSKRYYGNTKEVNYLAFPTLEAAIKVCKLAELESWEVHKAEKKDNSDYYYNDERVAASKDILEYEAAAEVTRQAEIKLKQARVDQLNKTPKVFSLGTFKDLVTDKLLSFRILRVDATLSGDVSTSGTGYIECAYTMEILRSDNEVPMKWQRVEYYFTDTGQVRKDAFYNRFRDFIGDEFLDEVMRELKGIYYRYNEVKKLLTTNIIEEEVKK
jgi:hypothetical protein